MADVPFVGRDAAVATVVAALEEAAAGEPRVVVVRGDLGIGKTRLVTEALRRARPIVLSGACAPVVGEPLPYAPLVQALRRLDTKPQGHREIARFPDLARLMAGEAGADVPTGLSPATSPQLRLFQSVVDLLGVLGRTGPVALVLDDLHWADPGTLDLVTYAAATLTAVPVTLVVTCRDDAGSPSDDAHRAIAELGRLRQTRVLALGPLPDEEAATLATHGDASLDPAGAVEVARRAAGNPFLVLQFAGHQATPELPPSVWALFAARLDALPDGARSLAHGLAVLGGHATPELLAAVVDRSEEELEWDLRAAVDRHVVVVDIDAVAFRHPACAEVAYADALPSARRRLHARAAGAVVGRVDDESVLARARHWDAAGVVAEALPDTVAAAEVANRRWAFADAARLYQRAELLGRDAGVGLARIRVDGARAAALAGDLEAAIGALGRALEEREQPALRAEILTTRAAVHFVAGQGEPAEVALAEARSLVQQSDDALVAAVYAWSARVAAAWSRIDDAQRFGTRALAAAERAGRRRFAGIAHNALGVATALSGDLPQALDHLRAALAAAREAGGADDLVAAYVNLGNILGLSGDAEGQYAVCRTGIDDLGRWGVLRHSGSVLMANAVEALLRLGRLREAMDLGRRGVALAPEGLIRAPILMRAAEAAALTGLAEQAATWIAEALDLADDPDTPPTWRLAITEVAAEVALWAGQPPAAWSLAREGLEGAAEADLRRPHALLSLAWRAVADLGDDPATSVDALVATEVLVALTSAWDGDEIPLETAERVRAQADHGTGAEADGQGEVLAAWRAAGESAAGPVAAAYVLWREAEERLRAGGGAEAIATLRKTHRLAVDLDLEPLVDDVQRAARWYRIDLDPGHDAPVGAPAPDAAGLTPREREILADLAAGRSNGEIGAHLGISVKTASVHVSNILRKLGVGSRQDAARVAHRHGVTGT